MENNNIGNLAASNVSPQAPAPLPVEPKKKMKWWKKILLIIIVTLLVVIGLALATPMVLSILFPGDAVLVDNSNLLLKKVSVADENNGFFQLASINDEDFYRPSKDEYQSPGAGSFSLDYTSDTKNLAWDQTLVDNVLAKNQKVLQAFSEAASKSAFQVPYYMDPANIHTNVQLYPMNGWREMARLQAINAISLLRIGKTDEALKEALKLNKVGHNIIVGHNPLIANLIGIAIQELGSKTIFKILAGGNISKQVLVDAQKVLESNSDNIEGYKNAFRVGYIHLLNSINETTPEILSQSFKDADSVEPTPENKLYARLSKYKFYNKPNQTINLYTDLSNLEVSAIGVRCEVKDLEEKYKSNEKDPQVRKIVLFTENAVGKYLFSYSGVVLGSAIGKGCENDLLVNVAQIELALKQYKMENGLLPETLDALVPQYMESVPLDPFDHKPLCYSAEKGIIYSVGLKKQDLGGSEGEDWTKMENPTFHIKF